MTDRPLVLRRTYDAPRERVFHAFTDAKQMERWYTPDIESPTSVERLDLRVGGGYRVVFGAGEDGTPWVEEATYLEVEPPTRLVMDLRLLQGDELVCETHNTIEFVDLGARTEVVMTETGTAPEDLEPRTEGWTSTLDNLYAALD